MKWYIKILLNYVKPTYGVDVDDKYMTIIKCKKLFGAIYVLESDQISLTEMLNNMAKSLTETAIKLIIEKSGRLN